MKRKASEDGCSSCADPHLPSELEKEAEEIDLDDLCAICRLLLFRPVTTRCGHTLCEYCMARWADISISTQMTTASLHGEPLVLLPSELETRCPMCRTPTTASLNQDREHDLRARYPLTYQIRETEEHEDEEDVGGRAVPSSVETLTLYIGNTHQLVRPESPGSHNKHNWKFFVRPSRTDLIEEVQIFLHPTFRNHLIIVQHPPYEIRRLGWGFFTIYANVVLKPGYSWVSVEAEDTPDGGKKSKLSLEWTLDFSGRGSQVRCRMRVRKETKSPDVEDVAPPPAAVQPLWTRQHTSGVDGGDESG